MFVVKKTHTW